MVHICRFCVVGGSNEEDRPIDQLSAVREHSGRQDKTDGTVTPTRNRSREAWKYGSIFLVNSAHNDASRQVSLNRLHGIRRGQNLIRLLVMSSIVVDLDECADFEIGNRVFGRGEGIDLLRTRLSAWMAQPYRVPSSLST
jgi:hypothetical protein